MVEGDVQERKEKEKQAKNRRTRSLEGQQEEAVRLDWAREVEERRGGEERERGRRPGEKGRFREGRAVVVSSWYTVQCSAGEEWKNWRDYRIQLTE